MYVVSKIWFSFQRLSSDTKVLDVKGKDLPAVDIVSYAIKYLINHMLNEHKSWQTTIEEAAIYWVLIVPAMWDNPGKQFMIYIHREEFMDSYCQNNTADYLDLLRLFEKKRYEKVDEDIIMREVTLKVPPTFVIKYKDKTGKRYFPKS